MMTKKPLMYRLLKGGIRAVGWTIANIIQFAVGILIGLMLVALLAFAKEMYNNGGFSSRILDPVLSEPVVTQWNFSGLSPVSLDEFWDHPEVNVLHQFMLQNGGFKDKGIGVMALHVDRMEEDLAYYFPSDSEDFEQIHEQMLTFANHTTDYAQGHLGDWRHNAGAIMSIINDEYYCIVLGGDDFFTGFNHMFSPSLATLSHELGHCLLNAQGHYYDRIERNFDDIVLWSDERIQATVFNSDDDKRFAQQYMVYVHEMFADGFMMAYSQWRSQQSPSLIKWNHLADDRYLSRLELQKSGKVSVTHATAGLMGSFIQERVAWHQTSMMEQFEAYPMFWVFGFLFALPDHLLPTQTVFEQKIQSAP